MSRKKIFIIIIVAVIVLTGVFLAFAGGEEEQVDIVQHTVIRGDVEELIQASGVIRPIERREITAMVGGEVWYSPFEVGDIVSRGDILYRIDDTDARLNVQQRQIGVSQAHLSTQEINDNINRLTITAPATGTLTGFDLNIGDNIGGGGGMGVQIGTVIDNHNLTVRIPFNSVDADLINVGDSVMVTSAQFMTAMDGRVSHVYNSTTTAYGGIMRYIEISLVNPGALSSDVSVAATVFTAYGQIMSAGSGRLSPGTTAQVIAEQAGRVEEIFVRDGQQVTQGQVIARLSNVALTNQRENNQLTIQERNLGLETQLRRLDDFTITSPIDGIVIDKNRDVGDNVGAGAGMREILMVVADTSSVAFDIEIDEMEISRVQLGQSVIVTVEALPGRTFDGVVTEIAVEGRASQGVTKFDVEITIAEPGDLAEPGNLRLQMNADANIVVESSTNVLRLPESAIMAGGMVFLFGESGMTGSDGTPIELPAGAPVIEAPEGYGIRIVQTGVRSGRFVEIVAGLQEGDIVGEVRRGGAGGMFPGGGMMPMGSGMMPAGGGTMQFRTGGGGGGGGQMMVVR